MSADDERAGSPLREHVPLYGWRRTVGGFAISMATFMTILDGSIANVSIPAIAGDLGISPSQGAWVITAFGVSNAISVPLAGWMTRRFGQIRLMITLMLLFVGGSWLCGMANNLETLIAFRILQGLVTGPMLPLATTLLLSAYPATMAGTALALSSVTVLVAPVIGPMLGGWLTDLLSWHWIFFINIPIGLVAAAVIWSIFRHRDTERYRQPVDVIGLVLLVLWVGSLQLVVSIGRDHDWFESNGIILLTLIGVAGFLFFLAWELNEPHPIVDLRLFAQRNFAFGVAVLAIGYGLFFGNAVLMPLWLLQHMGFTPVWAGIALAPMGLFALVMTPWVGRNVARYDPRLLISIALVAYALVFWLRSLFNTQTDLAAIVVPTLVQGIAQSFFFIPLQAVVFQGVSLERRAAVAGLSNFARLSAGALGASIAITLWQERASMHHARLVEEVVPDHLATVQTQSVLQSLGFASPQQWAVMNGMIDQQAYTLAATDIFHVSSILFILLGVLIWRTDAVFGGPGAAYMSRPPATPSADRR